MHDTGRGRGDLVAQLADVVGADAVLTGEATLSLYAHDASTIAGDAPVAVVLPSTTTEVAAVVRCCVEHDLAVVARGAGTGLAGGAVPVGGAVVVSTLRMDRIESVDVDDRVAWVQPGVLNLDLNRALAPHGLCFSPDPSSQQACTIGGNVANNSGGPHCLADGVTSAHVAAVEVVLPDGGVVVLGGVDPEPVGYDLRGAFVGSEGTMGIATRVAVRLQALPPAVTTLLVTFDDDDRAAETVSAIIAAGIVPAALEMIDGPLAAVLEDYAHAGFPRDAAAVLMVELEGSSAAVDEVSARVEAVIAAGGAARTVRRAVDDDERARWWKARKSAFGAIARIEPDYVLHDTVVPRSKLPAVLREVRAAAARHGLAVFNVFHAGDGNLHPLLVFDARRPGAVEAAHAAGDEIVDISLAAGGVLSGEHGIGIEKRAFMDRLFAPVDLEAQDWLRTAFDPERRANPHKVLPRGSRCGEVVGKPGAVPGTWV